MPIRISGIASGLDTDSIVKELVSSYQIKTNKYKKDQTKLEWKQDIWKDLNAKIYNLYTNTLGNMRFSKAYNSKKTSVSDETKASVIAANSAVLGTQTLSISQLAKAGYLTGGVLKKVDSSGAEVPGEIKSDSTLADLGVKDNSDITVTLGDGTSKRITLSKDMKVSELVNTLKETGLGANFDETNQRFFVNSLKTGEENNFSLTADNANGMEALKSLKLLSTPSADSAERKEYERLSAFITGVNPDGSLAFAPGKEAEYNAQITQYNQSLDDGKQGRVDSTVKERTDSILSQYAKLKDLEKQKSNDTNTAEDIAKIEEDIKKVTTDLKKDYLSFTTGVKKEDITDAQLNSVNLSSVVTEDADGKYSLSSSAETAIKNQTDTDISNAIAAEKVSYKNNLDDRIKYAHELITTGAIDSLGSADTKKIEGQDAKITLNGADFTSSNNSFSINGLTITAKAETTSDITLTTDTDVDAIYDTIKNFFKGYNDIIKEMDTKYNAKSAKGYEPLTDEEKEAMSEKEVEKWENKIKDSLLRRDNILSGVISTMKTAMQRTFEIDGKKYSLSSFGIKTEEYFSAGDNEKGVYHIDGNKDDTKTSEKDDILKSMIASDPDTVTSFFTQLVGGLYTDLSDKMKSSTMRSAFTVYNDKQMQKDYDDYSKKIKKWEKYVTQQEEYWYNKFTAMETALSKLQSNTSALSGLLGG